MRTIKLSNEKKRDASVSYEAKQKQSAVMYVLPDGSNPKSVKLLKTTVEQDLSSLLKKYGNLDNLAKEIIAGDPEIDFERTGLIVEGSRKLIVTKDHQILYGVDLYEIVRNPDGTEKERHLFTRTQANINADMPVLWSGKLFPKSEAIKMVVFSRAYQIRHVNGLTYDFLYDMAMQLHEKNAFMLIGAGKKGMNPLIFHDGGVPYRGFLEGRIKGDTYCLILHLSNMELKEVMVSKEISS